MPTILVMKIRRSVLLSAVGAVELARDCNSHMIVNGAIYSADPAIIGNANAAPDAGAYPRSSAAISRSEREKKSRRAKMMTTQVVAAMKSSG